ncbi:uncharacterized protein HD556DRAFT_249938 [Suillus plorans]|uniref:Uncharacterized protein n=1 Tax=Suillus plorans TaxID=116603 RepID=A0A9P7IYX3_9AGAM|nr:uncharacterized protein HD556DRAFT_249938 [Suillus plorans]KAG1797317.1 hypothetical protein HD556DRAFT_249938 [Suillus plorans]
MLWYWLQEVILIGISKELVGRSIRMPYTSAEFSLARELQSSSRETALQVLSYAWGDYGSRHQLPEDLGIENLMAYIDGLLNLCVARVREWISSNVACFQSRQASIVELTRTLESATVGLKNNFCKRFRRFSRLITGRCFALRC